MKKYDDSAPVYKTMAEREAETILLRNAPDEDQLMREYLAKQMHANGVACKQSPVQPVEASMAAMETVVDNMLPTHVESPVVGKACIAKILKPRHDYSSDYSSRRHFCG